jgi:hypothetical protein
MDKARVSLTGEFTASEFEEIIRDLAQARASLQPAVPMRPPSTENEGDVLLQEDSQFTFAKLATGGLRIWLRNEGIGWLAFNLSATDVRGIREFLAKQGRDGTYH